MQPRAECKSNISEQRCRVLFESQHYVFRFECGCHVLDQKEAEHGLHVLEQKRAVHICRFFVSKCKRRVECECRVATFEREHRVWCTQCCLQPLFDVVELDAFFDDQYEIHLGGK